jgi:hypothetical protein
VKTKERLAQRLDQAGLHDLAWQAREGKFSDFESSLEMPKVELVRLLKKSDLLTAETVAKEVMHGDFDDTKEEADEWFKREGRDLL